MTPFDYIKAINESKVNLMEDSEESPILESEYIPFIVNRGLSLFPDTILYANEMNMRPNLGKKPQFLYLLNTIRRKKRYSKWFKKEKYEDIENVSTYFNYSLAKAKEAVKVLTAEQLQLIKIKLEQGGVNTGEKRNDSKC
jgi:hypothetical protein